MEIKDEDMNLEQTIENNQEAHKSEESTQNLLTESLKSLISPILPMKNFEDFSQNSFVFVDTTDADFEYEDNSILLENNNIIEITNKSDECIKNDVSNVYMKSILDLFRSLNFKIDNISLQKQTQKHIIEEVHGHLLLNDSKAALKTINRHLGDIKPEMTQLCEQFIRTTLKDAIFDLKNQILNVEETVNKAKNIYNEIESKLYKKLEENKRLMNIINQQSVDHKAQVDNLVQENSIMKDEIINLIKILNPTQALDSKLQEDIIQVLKNKIEEKIVLVEDLQNDNFRKEGIIQDYVKKSSNFEVCHLNKQIVEFKITQKKLQDENINLSQIISKMSEKNTKLKQELVLFNTEYKRAVEAIKIKNETISRQKTLIEMFQEKLTGTNNFPIEELRKKKYDIESKLERENDFLVKQALKKEKNDCEKRLSDFLSIQSRKV